MRAFRTVLCAALLVSCSGERELFLQLPTHSAELHTMIVAFVDPSAVVLHALQLDEEAKLSYSGEVETVTVLYYKETLDELGLTPGRLPLAPKEACLARGLAPNDGVFGIDAVDEETELAALDELPLGLRAVRFELPCPCYDFTFRSIPLPERSVTTAVELDDSHVVLATHNRFLKMDQNGTITELGPVGEERFFGAARGPDGSLWFGTLKNRFYTGTPPNLIEIGTSSPTARLEYIAPWREGTAVEVFTLDSSGHFRVYNGAQWELLLDEPKGHSSQLGDLVWLEQGTAILMVSGGQGFWRYDHDRPTKFTRLEWDSNLEPPSVLSYVEGFGVMMATRTGRIHQMEGNNWKLVEDAIGPDVGGNIRDFEALDGGFLQSGDQSRLSYYHPAVGLCFDERLEGDINLKHITRAGPNYIITGSSNGIDNKVFVVELTHR